MSDGLTTLNASTCTMIGLTAECYELQLQDRRPPTKGLLHSVLK